MRNYILELNDVLAKQDNSSSQYKEHAEVMMEEVNNEMIGRADIKQLTGNTPLTIMVSNHQNHVDFINSILMYKDAEVLISTLPWVYSTYSAKGFQYEYFEYELNAWKKAIKTNIDNETGKKIILLYDFMLEFHNECIERAERIKTEETEHEENWSDIHESILQALINGDYKATIKTLQGEYNLKNDVVEIYKNVLQTVMYEIGNRWSSNEISIAREHLASSTLARLMAYIYQEHILDVSQKGVAIMSAGVNEYHQLGARMVADALELDGWDIRFLGADTPVHELVGLINEIQPVFVGISVTMMANIHKVESVITSIKSECGDVKIMVGGRAISTSTTITKQLGADCYPTDILESIEYANSWSEGIK